MKKILVACLLALSGLAATAAPSFADSITITTGNGYYPHHRYHDYYRPGYRPYHRWHHPAYRHGCRTKTVKYYHHGRWVRKTTRVCRY